MVSTAEKQQQYENNNFRIKIELPVNCISFNSKWNITDRMLQYDKNQRNEDRNKLLAN